MKNENEIQNFRKYLDERLNGAYTNREKELIAFGIDCIDWVLNDGNERANKDT